MREIRKIIRSVTCALKGLRHAYASDKSFRMEINYGLPIYLLLAFVLCPFEPWELLFFTFSYLLILLIELVNTAFETMIDHLHPNEHQIIAKSKDIASASVFVAFVFAALVVFVLAYTRFTHSASFVLGSVIV